MKLLLILTITMFCAGLLWAGLTEKECTTEGSRYNKTRENLQPEILKQNCDSDFRECKQFSALCRDLDRIAPLVGESKGERGCDGICDDDVIKSRIGKIKPEEVTNLED